MIRKIIQIDEELCNGCGACASACHEGAIGMVNGKAKLLRDDYCDGLGDCLPACPTGAITFVEREAAAYDEAAVQQAKAAKSGTLPCGCPGSQSRQLHHEENDCCGVSQQPSRLRQWPVQIQLVPVRAPYFDGCDLLVAADCSAYAYGPFHENLLKGKILVIGCPKLDPVDYTEKLEAIFRNNDIRSITVARMEVPCCGGLERAVEAARAASGKEIPLEVLTISAEGEILRTVQK